MIGVSYGAVLDGLDAAVIKVEADVGRGLPQFSIVGLPDSAVSESKLRIRSAFRNAGLQFPQGKITVNLSPASLRKRGAGLDLAIAVAILRAAELLPQSNESAMGFVGELSLSGELTPVNGILNLALAFRRQQILRIAIAAEQQPDCLPLPGLAWFVFTSLSDVVEFLRDPQPASSSHFLEFPDSVFQQTDDVGCFSDVIGLEATKRALTIAAAGHHHVLLIGPPGCGKTMIAERFASILPPLTDLEALEVYAIHQASGLLRRDTITPPLRSPHHTLTTAGLIGGGNPLSAGEVTLAHHGVLLLDELLEFPRTTLDALREPLVTRSVRLTRSGQTTVLPADFILLGTLNPCPCGQRGFGECRCTNRVVDRYWSRLSGPLLDRIDLVLHVSPNRHELLPKSRERKTALTSREIQKQVIRAANILGARTSVTNPLTTSARVRKPPMTRAAANLIQQAMDRSSLSRRGMESVKKVAYTISVLENESVIALQHIQEAMAYRSQNKATSL